MAAPGAVGDPAGKQPRGASELFLRIASALVLAPLAVAVTWLGGWPFVVFWTCAAAWVMWEWAALVAGPAARVAAAAASIGIAVAGVLLGFEHWRAGAVVIALGAVAAGTLAPGGRRLWTAAGVLYSGGMIMAASLVLRQDAGWGFLAVVFVFAVVWATDIAAYFAGRRIGGPKLWPALSPNKTWSGALAGALAAALAGTAALAFSDVGNFIAIVLITVLLSVVAQAGDLFESALKRRFGAKDAGHLIPGHGGLMDRLDGFATAAFTAALIGLARGGIDAPGRGLLLW